MASITVQDLDLWRDSILLVKSVQSAVRSWSSKELEGIAAQALQVSVSIPASLGDGRGRSDPSQTRRFAQIALNAAFELETLLIISSELGGPDLENLSALRRDLTTLMRRLENFISTQEWLLRGRYHARAERL